MTGGRAHLPVEAVFDRIPPAFVDRYRGKFEYWGRNLRKIGKRCVIRFYDKPGKPPLLNPDGSPMMRGAFFKAELDTEIQSRPRLVISPESDRDVELVAKHTREIMNILQ
jgi:hypothetical protein